MESKVPELRNPPPLPERLIIKPPPLVIQTKEFLHNELEMVRKQLVFLETLECRKMLTKEKLTEVRRATTEQFKLLLRLTE
jgi:hypothetical protein